MIARLGPLIYGLLFTLVLPALLVAWAGATRDLVTVPFDGPAWRWSGYALLVVGVLLQLAAMANLWTHGGGLPMNAYPPPRYVTRGAYRFLRHPIYVGFCLACAGIALAAGSASGLLLVTPVVILLCVALVLGYEQPALEKRFASMHYPLLGPPPPVEEPPTFAQKLGAAAVVFLPWLLLYELLIYLGDSPLFFSTLLPGEEHWPVIESMEYVYALTYPFVVAAPLLFTTQADLRRFVHTGWWLTFWGIYLEFVLPFHVPPRAFTPTSFAGELLLWERSVDGPVAAFPSFHVMWALVAARCWSRRFPSGRLLWWTLAALMAVSCVAVGNHSLADVLAGVVVYAAVERRAVIWRGIQRQCERLANSWTAWHVGSLRIINHSLYAALAAATGILLVGQFLPDLRALLLLTLAILVGAALWGQVVIASTRLLRPFGYYGGLLGGVAGMLIVQQAFDQPLSHQLAALALAAPWVQALGRLRCLVQGCCHGRPTEPEWGIVYRNPHSRVCAISHLCGIPVHNTPLYSILGNALTGLFLLRLWYGGASTMLLAGLYFILNGCCRFVEEAFRGEIQTPVWGGLRLYQWTALASILAGAVVTCLPATELLPFSARYDAPLLLTCLAGGLLAAFALSMDFPRSSRRGARLSG